MTHKDKHKHPVDPPPGGEQTAGGAQAAPPAECTQTAGAPAPSADETAPAAAKTAADELAALRAQSEDLLKRLQRVSADYLNYQKRIQKEIAQSREYANEALLKAMLPVLDDIDRALEAGAATHGPDDPLLTGLRLVRDKALAALAAFGLAAVESQGKPFDPEHHSAVVQQPSAEVPPGTVLKELTKGYALKGRTIRPAMVVVSVAPEKKPGAGSQ
jgi:molecular chaperone GrpE